MPIFDYECEECKYVEEILMVSPYDHLTCSKCGNIMTRLYTIGSHIVIWKGGHWNKPYHNDRIARWSDNYYDKKRKKEEG